METGDAGGMQDNENHSYKQFSIFIAVMVICFSICLMWVRLLMKWNFVFHYYPCTLCMILSTVGLIVAMTYYKDIKKRADRSTAINNSTQHNRRPKLQTLYYLVVVAYLFAVGNFLLDMSAILTIFHCSTSKYDLEYTSLVVFHITRLVFVALQLLFFQEMVPIALKPLPVVKFLIAFVIGTNVSNWFTLYLQLGILELKSEKVSFEYRYLNCTDSGEVNTIYEFAKSIDENTNPFNMEFSMMAVVLLFHIYPQHSTNTSNAPPDSSVGTDESNIKIPVNVLLAQEYSSDPGLLFGMALGVLAFMCYLNLGNTGPNYSWDVLFNYIAVGLIDIVVIIVSKKIWDNINKFHKRIKSKKDTADSRVLYLSAILGYFPHYTTVIIASIIGLSSTLETINASFLNQSGKVIFIQNVKLIGSFMLLRGIVNLISPIYQASVISKMHRYNRQWYNTDDEIRKAAKDSVLSAARIKQYLLVLVMANIGIWSADSFILLKSNMGALYLLAYEHLGVMFFIVTSLCVPIKIFYRIHAAAMSLNIWLSFTPPLERFSKNDQASSEDSR